MQDKKVNSGSGDVQAPSIAGQEGEVATPAVAPELLEQVETLTQDLAAKSKTVEKLRKYIGHLETDGDRLNQELILANSYRINFDSIIGSLTTPLFLVDTDFRIYFANKAFLEMTNSTEEILKTKPKCSDFLNCTKFRKNCLLKECFATNKAIYGFKSGFINSTDNRFKLVVDAIPILNLATDAILGGAEIFREVTEDTQLKHLMFSLADQEFGVSIKKIKEIISLMEITTIPNMPEHICGVINLRGKVVPIIDLKVKLGLGRAESTGRGCIFVVESKSENASATYGFIADQVNRIITIDSQDIDISCRTGIMHTSNCIAGIARVDRSSRILIDLDHAFNVLDYTSLIEQQGVFSK